MGWGHRTEKKGRKRAKYSHSCLCILAGCDVSSHLLLLLPSFRCSDGLHLPTAALVRCFVSAMVKVTQLHRESLSSRPRNVYHSLSEWQCQMSNLPGFLPSHGDDRDTVGDGCPLGSLCFVGYRVNGGVRKDRVWEGAQSLGAAVC